MTTLVRNLYEALVFKYSKVTLLVTLIIIGLLAPYAGNFRLDASSDSLVLENDKDLEYFSEVVSKYSTSELLIITYSPKDQDLFSEPVLDDLGQLREKLLKQSRAKSILSILDVPLTQSPPVTLTELSSRQQVLRDPETQLDMAKLELRDSAIYRDLLVSDDFSTTAIVVELKDNPELRALYKQRNELRDQVNAGSTDLTDELERITLEHQTSLDAAQARQDAYIDELRLILEDHEDMATIFLGGLPMIVTDSIRFIKGDVANFGLAALAVIIIILALAFRQIGWVLMPLAVCGLSGLSMVSLLGFLNWPISVVSSNFLSLLLIITLSLNIHLIVRYRELHKTQPELDQESLLKETIRFKFIACLYTALTTVVAFASLIVSGIRPVIDFGVIMCLGIAVSLIGTFILFPTLGMLMKPTSKGSNRDALSKLILGFAESAYRQKTAALFVFGIAAGVGTYGLMNLTVENRFIDYFKSNTDIYQGMYEIDAKLGGTTPLDIIIDAPQSFFDEKEARAKRRAELLAAADSAAGDDDFDDFADFEDSVATPVEDYDADFEDSLGQQDEEFDDFDDFDDSVTTNDSAQSKNDLTSSYWYNVAGLEKLKAIHDDLEAYNETGKVLSLATSMSIFENLKDATEMDDIDLGFLYNVVPENLKTTLYTPYLSTDGNQTHINIRVFETHKGLNRDQLIDDIRSTLVNKHGLEDEQVNINGMVVLYNNMLNSLFESQILTLGTVFVAIMLMFAVLYRSFKLALITIIPNVFSAGVVLGIMGVFSIPLDLMTITIAAITVGIAVDNAIHYVTRYRDERQHGRGVAESIDIAKDNVGQAMFYTTLTIAAGFLIMVFSNFVPTVYFGLLTSLAMITALIANLVMLPMLLEKFKP